jgi:hypothetical protein
VQRLVAAAAEVAPGERAPDGAADRVVDGAERVGERLAGGERDGEERGLEPGDVAGVQGERERHLGRGLTDRGRAHAPIAATIASPKPEHDTSFAPGIWRARS